MSRTRTPHAAAELRTTTETPPEGIFTRDRLKTLCLILITAVVACLCFWIATPFLPAITWALALAVIGRPVHHAITRRCRYSGLAAGISVVLAVIVVAAPIAFLVYHLVGQATAYADNLNGGLPDALSGPLSSLQERYPQMEPVVKWIRENIDLERDLVTSLAGVSRGASSFLSGTAWLLMQTLIMLLTLFYFFRDESQILQGVRRVLPLSMAESEELFARIDDTIHAAVHGSLFVGVIQGTLGGAMFWWLGLPTPLLWGLVMGLLAMIPNLGTFVIWAPAAALLALGGHWGKAVVLVAWGLIAIGMIDNLLYPVLVGERMRLHPLVVFFAVIGGLALFGASGVVLGPVLFAILIGLIHVWRGRTAGGEAADAPSAGQAVGPAG